MPPRPPTTLQQLGQNLQTNALGRQSNQAAAMQEIDTATRRLTQSRERLQRATERLQKTEFATDRERERAVQGQRRALQQMEQAQEHYNDTIRRSATLSQNMFRRLSEEATAAAAVMGGKAMAYGVGQMNKAYQAMIQTARHAPRTTAEGTRQLGAATAEYVKMLGSATVTALRYGQSLDEITEMQHHIVQAFQVDVTRTEFAESVSHLADTISYVAARTGHSAGEIQNFTVVAMQAMGRGTRGEMEKFGRQFRAITQLPTMMRESLGGLDDELGAVFANREFNEQIREWSTQFADQATDIGRMATAMALFEKQAVKAGHSVATVTGMTNAVARGIMGQTEDSAVTVMTGQRLQRQMQEAIAQRNAGNTEMWDKFTKNLNDADKRLVEDLSEGDGLQASDLFHLLRTSPEAMNAYMQSLVGTDTGNVSINRRMLAAQGITTGDPSKDLRLAQMIADVGQGNVINPDEVDALLREATSTEDAEETDRNDTYRNVGLIAEGMQKVPELLGKAVDYLREIATSGGGGSFLGSLLGAGAGAGGGSFLSSLFGGTAAGGGGAALLGGGALAVGGAVTAAAASVGLLAHELGSAVGSLAAGRDVSGIQNTATADLMQQLWKLENRGNDRSFDGGTNSAQLTRSLQEMWDRTENFTGIYSEEESNQILEELKNASGFTNSGDFQKLLDTLRDTGAYDDVVDAAGGQGAVDAMLKRIQDRERPSTEAIQQVLDQTLSLGRDQARNAIQGGTPQTAPVTVPAGTTRPGAGGAAAPGTTPRPAGPIRSQQPGQLRLDPSGRATATFQLDLTNFTDVVAQANVINAQTVPAGMSIRGA